MRFAIISDIHNNLEAFQTVLDDISRQKVDKICCLGDLLGYGPEPIKCFNLVLDLKDKGLLDVCLLGNHDQAAMFDPHGFNHLAERAIYWTRDQLESKRDRRSQDRMDFLGDMQSFRSCHKGELLFVHGSPFNTLNEYVFEEDVESIDKMKKLFDVLRQRPAKFCFMGHTHVPGIFVNRESESKYVYYSFKDIVNEHGGTFKLGTDPMLINVGSVGQPRDGDPRSCYVILNYEPNSADNYVEYRRLPYDVDKTVQAFKRIYEFQGQDPPLDFLWQRIQFGR